MNETIKSRQWKIFALSVIQWILIIYAITTGVNFDNAHQELLAGLISFIIAISIIKLLPAIKMIKAGQLNEQDSLGKTLLYWGVIFGDPIFATVQLLRLLEKI